MTAMAASGIGKLFGLGKNKPPKTPRKDYDSDEGDPYEYQDPSKLHPTQPPSNPGNQAIPNYPPPRPHHSPQFLRSDPDKRASAPVLSALEPSGYPQGLRPQRPQSSEHSKYINELSPKNSGPGDDYQDPWDVKHPPDVSKGKVQDYSEPWDSRPTPVPRPRSGESRDRDIASNNQEKAVGSVDDYCDPWDTKKQEKLKQSRDDYSDPWDAKMPGAKSSSSTESHERDSDEDEDSYSEPYDTDKFTVLDGQSKRMSLKAKGQPANTAAKDSVYDEVYNAETKKQKAKATKKLSAGNDEVFHQDTAKRKTQSPTVDDRPTDDYDTPWEKTKPAIPPAFRGNKKATVQEKRTSVQQPSFDSRQADDYDKPWEWTTKMIVANIPTSPAHAKSNEPSQTPRIDLRPGDDYDAPWEYSSRRQTAGQTSGPPKPPRAFGADPMKTIEGEEGNFFDPNLPLDQQGWYHGSISRLEAETLLREAEDCSYLVRNSESSKKDYSLSVRSNDAYMHLKIQCNWDGKFILGQFSKPFDTLPEMIHFYTVNKLNIRGAEHKKLRCPVDRQSNFYHVLEKTHL